MKPFLTRSASRRRGLPFTVGLVNEPILELRPREEDDIYWPQLKKGFPTFRALHGANFGLDWSIWGHRVQLETLREQIVPSMTTL